MRIRLVGFFAGAVGALVLAACGGGGGNLVVIPTATPAPAVAPTTQTVTATVTTSGATLTFGPVSNGTTTTIESAKLTLPPLSAAGTVRASLSSTLPTGVSAPAAKKRVDALGFTGTTLLSVNVVFAQNETVDASGALTNTFATAPPVGNMYLVFYTAATGWVQLGGPVAADGTSTTYTFPSSAISPPLQEVAGEPYEVAVIETSPAVAVTPQPTLNPSATASYAGTKTIAFSYGFAFSYPSSAPTATMPPSSTTYSATATVSVATSSPDPVPSANAIDVHTAETDASSLETDTFGTDAWVGNGSAGTSSDAVFLFAQAQTEPSSANQPVVNTTYGTPQVLDEYPETGGASWTNSPQANLSYSYASGDSGTRIVNSNGSYSDTELIGSPANGGGTATINENGDGSGSLNGPIFGGGFINGIIFSAPAGGNVNIDLSYGPIGIASGYPPSQVITIPAFYTTPPVLYTETDTVSTNQTLPSSCTPNSYGSSGNKVERVISTLDTVMGFEESTTFDTYVVGALPVCLVSNDVVNYAYDMENNSPYLFLYGANGLGLQIQTTSESLVLQSGATGPMPTDRRAIMALQAHELSTFARARAKLERDFILHARNEGKGN